MADKTFRLEVVAPDEKLYSGEATFVVAQTTDGELGIMAGHAPLLGELIGGGRVTFTETDGRKVSLAVQGGFLSVNATDVIVLAEEAQFSTDVDVAAERAVLESAEEGSDEFVAARSRIRAVEAVN
ncbi:MAG: F0F1 ATP synthase subunit epsilon [Gordonia sp. (in: high G+C Gram-positive bacteria)]